MTPNSPIEIVWLILQRNVEKNAPEIEPTSAGKISDYQYTITAEVRTHLGSSIPERTFQCHEK